MVIQNTQHAIIFLRPPIRFGDQHQFRRFWVVGAHFYIKTVRAVHAFVHHIFHVYFCFLAGFDRRRTDDGPGRSAALHKFNLRLTQNLQGSISLIAQGKGGANSFIQFLVAFINDRLVNNNPGCAVFGRVGVKDKQHG